MATKYTCEFYSENVDASGNDQRWRIDIDSASYGGAATEFKCTSEGFTLSMDGTDDGMLSPIKTTSLQFNMLLENATLEGIIDDLQAVATGNEDDFSVAIYNYYSGAFRFWWVGYLLGDLVVLDDKSINRIINIKAVDGLTRLKYIDYDHVEYGGTRSALNIIKTCLSPLTLMNGYYGDTSGYIAHTPFYYNKGMLDGSTWDATWRENINHDPLALVLANVFVFKDSNGQPWSYYKVLEQILCAFQLRLFITQMDYQATGVDTNAMWFLQSPLVNHGNNNDDNYDSTQLIFYHSKVLTTDVPLSYDNAFNQSVSNPAQRAAGSKEMFISPLLSYKEIYSHSVFSNLLLGPVSLYSTLNQGQSVDKSFVAPEQGGFPNYFSIPLSGIEDTQPIGFTGYSQKISQQRLMITGKVSTTLVDEYEFIFGSISIDVGFNSAQAYWENNNYAYTDDNSISWYLAEDSGYHFPRMGLRVFTVSQGDPALIAFQNFWVGDLRFNKLYGSVPWLGAAETNAYPSNWKGYNGTEAGLAYNAAATYPSTVWVNPSTNTAFWGTDGNESLYWYATDENDVDTTDNHYAYFAPVYNQHNVVIPSGSDTWSNVFWESLAITYQETHSAVKPFTFTTGKIPWGRTQDSGAAYGFSFLGMIELFLGFERDRVLGPDGTAHYVCCKDWNSNKELDASDRGVHFSYTFDDVRVYFVGGDSGNDMYDYTVGYYQNGYGACSDEETLGIEMVIGDEPPMHEWIGTNADGLTNVYLGQFRFITTADTENDYVLNGDIIKWRTIHQTTTEDNKLHLKRPKMAIAHRYLIKQKLELKLIDRNTNFNLTRFGFSNILYWTSGEWYQNDASANIAFIPTGGTFVAGTGEWSITVEDCITYSKNNLTNKTYSSDD